MTVPRTLVLVISLPQAEERRRAFMERSRNAELPYRFFDAHTELAPELRYDPSSALTCHGRRLFPGELGCYSSHFALWRKLCSDEEHDQYIVLEDDVIVDWKRLKQIASHDFAAARHHYVRLYFKSPTDWITIAKHYIGGDMHLVRLLGSAIGTQGYVVTKEGARRLSTACKVVRRPIDKEMDRWWSHGVPNLSLFPFPILESAVSSTIEPARFDKQPRGTWRRRFLRVREIAVQGLLAQYLRYTRKAP